MGVHHAWGRLQRSLATHKNMQGYAQRFQNGFDCQGLWVEVEVEQVQSKNIKVMVSTNLFSCVKIVSKNSPIFLQLTKVAWSYFMDWDNSTSPCLTRTTTWSGIFWKFVMKRLDLQRPRLRPWCALWLLSSARNAYRTTITTNQSIWRYPSGTDNEHLLVWTTTPWTIPLISPSQWTKNKSTLWSKETQVPNSGFSRLWSSPFQRWLPINRQTVLGKS